MKHNPTFLIIQWLITFSNINSEDTWVGGNDLPVNSNLKPMEFGQGFAYIAAFKLYFGMFNYGHLITLLYIYSVQK